LRKVTLALLVFLLFGIGISSAASAKWSYKVSGNFELPSAATDGHLLFLGTDDGLLVALNKTTGKVEWQVQIGKSVSSSPFYYAGRVYVASSDGVVQAIDSKTKTSVWVYRTGGSNWGSSPYVYNEILYIGSENGHIYAINTTDARLVWDFATGGPIRSTPLLHLGRVYVGSGDSKVYSLNANNGKKIWEYTLGGAVWTSSPAAYLNMIYVGSIDGSLYALNATNGRLLGTFKTGGWVASSPIAQEGVVYFGSDDRNFYSIDSRTLALRWKFRTGGSVQSLPATGASSRGTIVYFGSNDNNVYALRANSGTLVWNFSGSDWAGSPIAEGNYAYFASYDGKVYAVSGLSCSINSPLEKSSISDDTMLVGGSASSAEGVRNVYVRVNRGRWIPASGTSEWSANLSLEKMDYGQFEVECMAVDSSGANETQPYNKIVYTKTQYVPPKEMQIDYRKEANAGEKITVGVLGDDGLPLQGATVKVGPSEYLSNRNGIAELAINEPGKYTIEISKEGYAKRTAEIEVKREVSLYTYLYIAVGVIIVIAVIFGLKRRRKT